MFGHLFNKALLCSMFLKVGSLSEWKGQAHWYLIDSLNMFGSQAGTIPTSQQASVFFRECVILLVFVKSTNRLSFKVIVFGSNLSFSKVFKQN